MYIIHYLKKYKYPEFVPHLDNKNIPIDINPNACEKNLVMDYDEVNLNSIKENIYDKLDKETEQKQFPKTFKEKYN